MSTDNTPASAVPTVAGVIRRVQAFITAQPRGGKQRICQELGLSLGALRRCESPAWRPSLRTLERIETIIPGTTTEASPSAHAGGG